MSKRSGDFSLRRHSPFCSRNQYKHTREGIRSKMNVLFVHHNFPAQFRHIAADLAARPNCSVAAIGSNSARALPDVRLVKYDLSAQPVTSHPFARRFDLECRRAEQVLYAATELAAKGFRPDVIVVHSGWGENLPLRAVFPQAKIIVYSEFYYRAEGLDVNFDPEFPQLGVDAIAAMQIRNASQLLGLADGDHGLSPTEWQRSTFPTELRAKIKVIHEGIDVDLAAPKEDATVTLADGNRLGCSDEIVTYVSRNLEPLRGYHIFMRALPEILKRRPKAQVLIVGGTRSSYGPPPPSGTTWKEIFLSEVREFIDLKRVHFLGNIALVGARLLHVSVRAVMVPVGSDERRLRDRGLRHRTRARGCGRAKRSSDRFSGGRCACPGNRRPAQGAASPECHAQTSPRDGPDAIRPEETMSAGNGQFHNGWGLAASVHPHQRELCRGGLINDASRH